MAKPIRERERDMGLLEAAKPAKLDELLERLLPGWIICAM
jgi:hypothetical protein